MTEAYLFDRSEIAEGGVRIAEVAGTEIGVFLKDGRYYAYRNLCPHQGGPVCEGVRIPRVTIELDDERRFRRHDFDPAEMHFVCPWHGWEFKLETGEAAGDPAIRLKRYEIVERDGGVYVRL